MKTPRSIIVRDYILANYQDGHGFRFDLLSQKVQVLAPDFSAAHPSNAAFHPSDLSKTTNGGLT